MSMLRSTSINKGRARLDQELEQLTIKKNDLKSEIRGRDAKNDIVQLETTQPAITEKMKELEEEIKLGKVKRAKLENKLGSLSNDKVNLVIQLQILQIQAQSLQKEAVEMFTPSTSPISEIRLKLIQIEASDELADLKHLFSLRKQLLTFARMNGLNAKNNIDMLICSQGQIQNFKGFLLSKLEENRLSQFKMVILKPIQQYVSAMVQLGKLIKQRSPEKEAKNFEQEKATLLMGSLKRREAQITQLNFKLRKTNTKIVQTELKLQKYIEYIEELSNQYQQLQGQQQKISNLLIKCKQRGQAYELRRRELRQIKEAINYLQAKKQQTSQSCTTKSLIVIDEPEFFFIANKQNCELDSSILPKTEMKPSSFKSPTKYSLTSKPERFKIQSPAWK